MIWVGISRVAATQVPVTLLNWRPPDPVDDAWRDARASSIVDAARKRATARWTAIGGT